MDEEKLIVYGVLAVAAYLIYQRFIGGTTKREAEQSLRQSGADVYPSTLNPGFINAVYTQEDDWFNPGRTTTYSFSPDEYRRFNPAQQLFASLPFIPKSWVFGS